MKPLRHPDYLKFLRLQPCCICGKTYGIEAAHTGPHGLSQKAPDSSALPLCRKHHQDSEVGLDRIGRAAFEDLHGVNVSKLVRSLQLRAEACGVSLEPEPVRKPVARAGALRGSRLARR
jgi:hypothetical protein